MKQRKMSWSDNKGKRIYADPHESEGRIAIDISHDSSNIFLSPEEARSFGEYLIEYARIELERFTIRSELNCYVILDNKQDKEIGRINHLNSGIKYKNIENFVKELNKK